MFNSADITLEGDGESITDPRVRGKEGDGFGFGLAIVKRLCDRFGWHLRFESFPGEGTIVFLDFS